MPHNKIVFSSEWLALERDILAVAAVVGCTTNVRKYLKYTRALRLKDASENDLLSEWLYSMLSDLCMLRDNLASGRVFNGA